ncbi:unnamed protein product [Cylindrotheca closterium]|uniref:DUF4116 domain-containing protein n=1 Tax=Cylindrotheca closterium TaxID=2856 RepID=A0AAD2G0M7_9STRA|nr:unnamed protein product [Cylindrotheca closterium]
MLHAVKHNARFWEYCSEELRGDRDILNAAAEGNSFNSLDVVPNTYQLDHPEFVACAIRKYLKGSKFSNERGRAIAQMIREEMWHDRTVAIAWLECGGLWIFLLHFGEDRERIRTATKCSWDQFHWASGLLKNDKVFVTQASTVDARILEYVSTQLFFDHDVVLTAFGRDGRILELYAEGDEQSFDYLVSFATKVRQRLMESRTFQCEFIGSAKRPSSEKLNCHLSMLNQGPEMLATYKDKIASYAGILYKRRNLHDTRLHLVT